MGFKGIGLTSIHGLSKYKFVLWKTYFDTGLGITNYVKYIIAFYGLASNDAKTTLMIAFVYGILCFFIGYFWFRWGFKEAEIEINNKFNLFVKEMRIKVLKRKA